MTCELVGWTASNRGRGAHACLVVANRLSKNVGLQSSMMTMLVRRDHELRSVQYVTINRPISVAKARSTRTTSRGSTQK